MLNIDLIREDFPILEDIIYFDSASTSLTPEPVVNSICDYYRKYNANIGRGAYNISIKAGKTVEETRNEFADFINVKPNEIIFTKNTTEGINLIANGLEFKKGENIIISTIEHHSNIIPWLNLKDIEVKILKANSDGIINPENLYNLIDKNTRLISISHINNAIGSTQNIKRICEIGNNENILTHIDGAQSIGHIPINLKKIKPDFMSFPGHKGLMGPTGTGLLYINEEKQDLIKPTNLGGGTIKYTDLKNFKLEDAPQKYEGGTLNISGIYGLKTAIEYINRLKIEKIEKYTKKLTDTLYEKLEKIGKIQIYGKKENLSNIVSFNIPGINPHDVSKILDETQHICLRSGHHCAIPSLNLINAEQGSIRASLHCYNTLEEINILTGLIEEISELQ